MTGAANGIQGGGTRRPAACRDYGGGLLWFLLFSFGGSICFFHPRVAQLLKAGFIGSYGELAALVGSHPRRIVGTCVKRYARRHPEWDHFNVFAKGRTLRPAYIN